MTSIPQLEAKAVSYTYEDGTKALQDISFTIQKGEKIALLGSNGSGKSTLFLTLVGIKKPVNGGLFYAGQPYEYSQKGLLNLRKSIGIVFQEADHQLFLSDVSNELSFGLFNLGYSKEVVKEKVAAIIEQVPLKSFLHKPVQFLSGGQKKLVTIADILVMEPEIILLDEPSASLDPLHTKIVHQLIESFTARGITVILSTHLVSFAYRWADRIFLMDQGYLLAEGSPETIFTCLDLLKQAHLEQPEILRTCLLLAECGLMDNSSKQPKNIEELELLLRNQKMEKSI